MTKSKPDRFFAQVLEKAVVKVIDLAVIFGQNKKQRKLEALRLFWDNVPAGAVFCAREPFSIVLKDKTCENPQNLILIQKDQGVIFMGVDWPDDFSHQDIVPYDEDIVVKFNFWHDSQNYDYRFSLSAYGGKLPFYVL